MEYISTVALFKGTAAIEGGVIKKQGINAITNDLQILDNLL